jgi:hypothetical protein
MVADTDILPGSEPSQRSSGYPKAKGTMYRRFLIA